MKEITEGLIAILTPLCIKKMHSSLNNHSTRSKMKFLRKLKGRSYIRNAVLQPTASTYQSGVFHHIVDIRCVLLVFLRIHIDLHGLHCTLEQQNVVRPGCLLLKRNKLWLDVLRTWWNTNQTLVMERKRKKQQQTQQPELLERFRAFLCQHYCSEWSFSK